MKHLHIIDKSRAKSLGMNKFFTCTPCNKGHLSERYVGDGKCIDCAKNKSSTYYSKNKDKVLKRVEKHYEKNKESILECRKAYYLENKERIMNTKKKYYHKNKEKAALWRKKYREKNKEKVREAQRIYRSKNREKINETQRRYYKNNPLKVFIKNALKRIEIAKTEKRKFKAKDCLGYSQEEFIIHIEKQFVKGMSWSNRSEWHIDHITPIKWFLDNGITDIKQINALSNLRPIWAKENKTKNAKIEVLI